MDIPFNKPAVVGKELEYIHQAIERGHLSGNGFFTKKCQSWFEEKYGFGKCLLTTSCTDALEMCALLLDIKKGDEVIMPSYTFVSTANAFALRGAEILFADSTANHPNLNTSTIEQLISPKTKAIVAVHYAGYACDVVSLKELCMEKGLFLIEDAAQAADVFEGNSALGSFGDMATFSFHETKNVQCGEGGMLVINNLAFVKRAEVLLEKGTNRQAFYRGQVDKYRWVDLGSSFLLSDLNAAYLWGQLEKVEAITRKRLELCSSYAKGLQPLKDAGRIDFPEYDLRSPNGHIFYILLNNINEREALTSFLSENGVMAVFHYQSLHLSPFYLQTHSPKKLPNSERFEEVLLRLPLYYNLSVAEVNFISELIISFFSSNQASRK